MRRERSQWKLNINQSFLQPYNGSPFRETRGLVRSIFENVGDRLALGNDNHYCFIKSWEFLHVFCATW